MFFKKSAVALAALAGVAHASPINNDIEKRQDEVCAAGGAITQVFISTQVVAYPVFINTYIANNTVININGGVC